MGSFNSKAASKQYPVPVDLSNKNVKTNEQRKEDGESFTNIKKSDGEECEGNQNVEEEDPRTMKRRNSNTFGPRRPSNVRVASYLWLVSSTITEDNLKESAMKCRSPGPSPLISPSQTDHYQFSKHESGKATFSTPQFYSYPTVCARTKTQSLDGGKRNCSTGIEPFSGVNTLRRSKSSSKSNACAMILTRSVGFGVDKPYYLCPVQRY